MTRFFTRSMLVAGIVGFVLCLSLSRAYADIRHFTLTPILNDTNAAICEVPFFTDEARAWLFIKQTHGRTWLTIIVTGSRPHALHTVWLRLGDPVTDDTITSPLTGFGATPMVPTDAIRALVDLTPNNGSAGATFGLKEGDLADFFGPNDGDVGGPGGDGFGTRNVANGFYTNRKGWGIFKAHLDFPVIGGAYPFAAADLRDFEIEPEDFGDKSSVTFKKNPFAVVLHCFDEKSHGTLPRATGALDQAAFLLEVD